MKKRFLMELPFEPTATSLQPCSAMPSTAGQTCYSDDELLALSGLQHLAYCERQWSLIHVEQLWSESVDTVRGELFHEHVDVKGYSTSAGVRSVYSLRLVSYSLGITGIADIVEFEASVNGLLLQPIEYKVGKPKIEDWDRVQLTAQVMCLEEMCHTTISRGALFYGQTRRREVVEVTDDLRNRVQLLSTRAHELASSVITPHSVWSNRCKRCSLIDICSPAMFGKDVRAYWELRGEPLGAEE